MGLTLRILAKGMVSGCSRVVKMNSCPAFLSCSPIAAPYLICLPVQASYHTSHLFTYIGLQYFQFVYRFKNLTILNGYTSVFSFFTITFALNKFRKSVVIKDWIDVCLLLQKFQKCCSDKVYLFVGDSWVNWQGKNLLGGFFCFR